MERTLGVGEGIDWGVAAAAAPYWAMRTSSSGTCHVARYTTQLSKERKYGVRARTTHHDLAKRPFPKHFVNLVVLLLLERRWLRQQPVWQQRGHGSSENGRSNATRGERDRSMSEKTLQLSALRVVQSSVRAGGCAAPKSGTLARWWCSRIG